MAKLADIDAEIRTGLKFLGIAGTIVIGLIIFFQGGSFVKNVLFPAPPAPPEQKFGKLPDIKFESQKPTKLDYVIDTTSGNLPSFATQVNIYKIIQKPPSLVALQTVRTGLSAVGFTENETKLSESTYQWSNTSGYIIQYNVLNNNFKILSNFLGETPPGILSGPAATQDGAYSTTVNFLQGIGENIEDIDQTLTKSIYLKLENGQLVQAQSPGDAQFIRIDLYQKPIDKMNVYYPNPKNSPMLFIYKNDVGEPTIVNANYVNQIPDTNQSSTYGIKSTQEAFEDLKSGNAAVFNDGQDSTINITDVKLGYYLGSDNQEYTLPVFVFTGKDFIAYVKALQTAPATSTNTK